MTSSRETRVSDLERANAITGARPALVLIEKRSGLTADQKTAAAAADKAGVQVIVIEYRDGRLPKRNPVQGITDAAPSLPGAPEQ